MTCLRVLVRKHKAFPPASEVLLSFFSPVPSAQNTQDVCTACSETVFPVLH